MKIIITGATGTIGGGALKRALETPEVTEVVVLARRDVGIKHPKLTWLLKEDFLSYTDEELQRLKGAEACIWSLGAPMADREIKMTYPRVALKTFTEHLVPALPAGKRFRYIHTSGMLVIADQDRNVWSFMKPLQQLGKLEVEWAEHEKQSNGIWRSIIVRPGFVHPPNALKFALVPATYKIPLPMLSAALIDVALNDSKKQTLNNVDLRVAGEAALAK